MNLRERIYDFVVDLAPLPSVPVIGTRRTFPVQPIQAEPASGADE